MKPRIFLPTDIRNKIQFIVDNCDKEVSGLGTVIFDKKANGYRVTSAILLDQEVGSAHTDIDDKAVAQALYESRNDEGELAFWWHSHVNMATFWSGQDHQTMEAIGKNGLCVAIVFNKKEEMRGAIVMSPSNMPSVKVDDVDIIIEYDYAFNPEELLAEIKEKVKEKSYSTHTNHAATDKVNNILASGTHLIDDDYDYGFTMTDQQIQIKWSKMSKTERTRYHNFQDFKLECQWGEEPLAYNRL